MTTQPFTHQPSPGDPFGLGLPDISNFPPFQDPFEHLRSAWPQMNTELIPSMRPLGVAIVTHCKILLRPETESAQPVTDPSGNPKPSLLPYTGSAARALNKLAAMAEDWAHLLATGFTPEPDFMDALAESARITGEDPNPWYFLPPRKIEDAEIWLRTIKRTIVGRCMAHLNAAAREAEANDRPINDADNRLTNLMMRLAPPPSLSRHTQTELRKKMNQKGPSSPQTAAHGCSEPSRPRVPELACPDQSRRVEGRDSEIPQNSSSPQTAEPASPNQPSTEKPVGPEGAMPELREVSARPNLPEQLHATTAPLNREQARRAAKAARKATKQNPTHPSKQQKVHTPQLANA